MESRKKQTSDRPKWEQILANARSESPPEIDVRPGVRAVLESALRSGFPIRDPRTYGLVEAILELFSRPVAKFGLGAAAVSVLAFALTIASMIDPSDLEDMGLASDETAPVIDESYVVQDWTEVL